jgi:ATP sulfurylase
LERISPLFAAVADSIGRFIGPKTSTSVLSPFAFCDGEVIKALLMEAGFPKVEIERLLVERRIGLATESIPKEIAGSPVRELVAKLDEPTEKALYPEIEEALRDFVEDEGIVVPQEAHLVRAIRQ